MCCVVVFCCLFCVLRLCTYVCVWCLVCSQFLFVFALFSARWQACPVCSLRGHGVRCNTSAQVHMFLALRRADCDVKQKTRVAWHGETTCSMSAQSPARTQDMYMCPASVGRAVLLPSCAPSCNREGCRTKQNTPATTPTHRLTRFWTHARERNDDRPTHKPRSGRVACYISARQAHCCGRWLVSAFACEIAVVWTRALRMRQREVESTTPQSP